MDIPAATQAALPIFYATGRCLVRPPMVYYVEHNALQRATGLWGLIWSHTVPSPMARRPACESSYGRIGFFSPVALRVLTRHAALTNHHHSIMVTYEHIWTDMDEYGHL